MRFILQRLRPANCGQHPGGAVAAFTPLHVVLLFAMSSLAFWLIYALALNFLYPDVPKLACLWDCIWYASIVRQGYDLVALPSGFANWAFFPAFPLLSFVLGTPLRLPPEAAVIVTSTLCYLAAALALRSYLLEVVGPAASRTGVLLFVFSGYAVYGHAGYAEPLYFLQTVLAFWSLRARKWIFAGLIGALLSASRPIGILLGPVFLIAGLTCRIDRAPRREQIAFLVGLALVPVGLLAFAGYLHLQTGDALAFVHVQSAWSRSLLNPLAWLMAGFRGYHSHPALPIFSALAVLALALAAYLIMRRYYEEGVSLLANVLIPLSTGLLSMPRHVWWQMPFLFGLTLICTQSKIATRSALIFSIIMFVFMAIAWASGAMFVV